MRRGAIQIPYEAFDRTVEYLDGAPGLGSIKFRAHAVISFVNLLSHLYRTHHFDSVGEFLEYKNQLRPNLDRVAFQEVEVIGREDRNHTLELTVSDGTSQAKIIFPYSLHVVAGHEMPPDSMNNPLHGARAGDKLQIFNSTYRGRSEVIVPAGWYTKNDDHYKRMREIRDTLTRGLNERLGR